jgi:hypothetical protein
MNYLISFLDWMRTWFTAEDFFTVQKGLIMLFVGLLLYELYVIFLKLRR